MHRTAALRVGSSCPDPSSTWQVYKESFTLHIYGKPFPCAVFQTLATNPVNKAFKGLTVVGNQTLTAEILYKSCPAAAELRLADLLWE